MTQYFSARPPPPEVGVASQSKILNLHLYYLVVFPLTSTTVILVRTVMTIFEWFKNEIVLLRLLGDGGGVTENILFVVVPKKSKLIKIIKIKSID